MDVDTDECLAIWASEGRTSFHAYVFLKEVLKYCENKPEVVVDRCFFFRLKERTKGSETDFRSIALLLQFRAGWKALWLSIITGNVKLTVPQNPSKFFFSF